MSFLDINLFGSNPRYDLVPVRLRVPFVSQDGKPECGIASTMMVLKYFGVKNPDRQRIKSMAELPYGKGSICYGLGKALVTYGIDADIVLPKQTKNKVIKNIERRLDEEGVTLDEFNSDVQQMKEDAINTGVKVEVRAIELDEVLGRTDGDTLPMVTLNPNRFLGSGQVGAVHCVVITGFDDHRVYYNNPAFYSAISPFPVKRNILAKAMKDVKGAVIFASRRASK